MKVKNVFLEIPDDLPSELFDRLIETNLVVIERIVSAGHASAEGFWYDQGRTKDFHQGLEAGVDLALPVVLPG